MWMRRPGTHPSSTIQVRDGGRQRGAATVRATESRRKDALILGPSDAVRLRAIAKGEAGAGQLNEVLDAPMDLGPGSVKTC